MTNEEMKNLINYAEGVELITINEQEEADYYLNDWEEWQIVYQDVNLEEILKMLEESGLSGSEIKRRLNLGAYGGGYSIYKLVDMYYLIIG